MMNHAREATWIATTTIRDIFGKSRASTIESSHALKERSQPYRFEQNPYSANAGSSAYITFGALTATTLSILLKINGCKKMGK
jgi:hypothetical protein